MDKMLEIPDADWERFCRDYGVEHHGWIVAIALAESLADEPVTVVTGMMLQWIGVNRQSGRNELLIGLAAGGHELSYRIAVPRRVFSLQTDDGLHRGLQVVDARGAQLRLEFRVPAVPEALDGWADT